MAAIAVVVLLDRFYSRCFLSAPLHTNLPQACFSKSYHSELRRLDVIYLDTTNSLAIITSHVQSSYPFYHCLGPSSTSNCFLSIKEHCLTYPRLVDIGWQRTWELPVAVDLIAVETASLL